MTKLEAWKTWSASAGAPGTEFTLEKSSHGKAFSYAWDAALAQPEQDQIETMTVDELKASLKRGEKWRVVELEQEPIGESGRFERLLREYKR